ncbi:hypothetical protein [Streptomyces sp. V3I7]|uniref:hypothetical protein n=1 Tax=Streptomyces sp. V3I7 TaxID=3042278 RepID=UPI0027899758|nr:hypothetical protein [Streptomyces sp. V3I7]MDQ0993891.1 hypothetical protein [Streptomyces sp. V3I7]
MDHQPTAAPALSATDPRLVLNALDHQFRGFRDFFFGRTAPAGPIVLPATLGTQLTDATEALADLLRRAVRSLGAECLTRHRALGLDERLTDFYGDEEFESRYATGIGRPDVVLTDSGWKFLEFNFCSATGAQTFGHLVNDLWRQLLPEDTLGRLVLADPLKMRNDFLRGVLDDLGLDARVALVGNLGDIGIASRRYYEVELESMRKGGIEAEYFETDEFLGSADSRRGEFPLVLERVVPQEWIDAGKDPRPLLAIKRSGAVVLSPQSSYQAANKQLFALLSTGQEWMTDEDRELVRTHIPWSRSIREDTVTYEGETLALTDLLLKRREDFVVKRSDGDQNFDVHLGWRTSPAEWEETIARARKAGTWIVQEAVHSTGIQADVLDCDSGTYSRITTRGVFGPLVMGGRVSACAVRYDVPAREAVAPQAAPPSIVGSVGWDTGAAA